MCLRASLLSTILGLFSSLSFVLGILRSISAVSVHKRLFINKACIISCFSTSHIIDLINNLRNTMYCPRCMLKDNRNRIFETNTYYEGSRYTTEAHRKTLEINGWTFCPVDITDSEGVTTLPVKGGKWFDEMHVGKSMLNYDSLLVLTHFKGHVMGGFGGSNKNIGIGCADGRIGKKEIHTHPNADMWSIAEEELMERISESTKATIDHFAPHVCYINTMRNMSVECDCAGPAASPVVTPDIGILASLDILAVDNACIDLIYNLPKDGGKELIERVETRHGLRQLSYMKELGMGNDRYTLIDIDNGDAVITAAEAVKDVEPGWRPDRYNTFWGRNKRA